MNLLDRRGKLLPTHALNAVTGTRTLARGRELYATGRFSPDVPDRTEGHPGRCEPLAYRLRVILLHARLIVPIAPPTPVCERGTITFSAFRTRNA